MTGDASDTTLTLSVAPVHENNVQVFFDGVYQSKSNYSISGTTLTFSTAPPDDVLVEAITNTNTTSTTANQLIDADSDTMIQVEESSDEDTIRMDIEGSEVAVLNSTSLTLKNPATADNSTFNLNLQTAEADIAADDVLAKISFSSPNEGTGTDALLTAAAIQAISEGDFSSSSNATSLQFMTGASEAATEKMRITSGGDICFKLGNNQPDASNVGWRYNDADSSNPWVRQSVNATSAATHIQFANANGYVGQILTNGSATAYNTSSDYRLKENIVTVWDATSRLKQLKPSRFNFKADSSTTVDGFLAHEVSSIVPEAIFGKKDEVDSEGEAVYQSIDHSKLVPLLVKTIQELEARITTLES
jgi:hypothetical protein